VQAADEYLQKQCGEGSQNSKQINLSRKGKPKMSNESKPIKPGLRKLYESAKRMHLAKLRMDRLAKLLANWPTVEEIRKDPARLVKLTRIVAKIEQAMALDRQGRTFCE
jgi:hypothetical protein